MRNVESLDTLFRLQSPKKETNAHCSRSVVSSLTPAIIVHSTNESNKSTIGSRRAAKEAASRLARSSTTSQFIPSRREGEMSSRSFWEIGGKCVGLPVARLSQKQRCCATRLILRSCLVYSRLYTGCLQTVTRGWVLSFSNTITTRPFFLFTRLRTRPEIRYLKFSSCFHYDDLSNLRRIAATVSVKSILFEIANRLFCTNEFLYFLTSSRVTWR